MVRSAEQRVGGPAYLIILVAGPNRRSTAPGLRPQVLLDHVIDHTALVLRLGHKRDNGLVLGMRLIGV